MGGHNVNATMTGRMRDNDEVRGHPTAVTMGRRGHPATGMGGRLEANSSDYSGGRGSARDEATGSSMYNGCSG
jgi:hypothetical protein